MRLAPFLFMVLATLSFAAMPALAQYTPPSGEGPAGNEQPDTAPGAGGGGAGGMPQGGGQMQQPGSQLDGILPPFQPDGEPSLSGQEHEDFADRVDLSPVRKLAVFHGGRAKILDTLARETVQTIHGRTKYKRPPGDPRYVHENDTVKVERTPGMGERSYDPVFTFLDLVFNGEYYLNRPLLHVPHVHVRRIIAQPLSGIEQERLMREGRVSPRLVFHPDSQQPLQELQQDAIRGQEVGRVLAAANSYISTRDVLNLVSPQPGDDRWPHLRELASGEGDATARADAAIELAQHGEGSQLNAQTIEIFSDLGTAWREGDHAAVNVLLEDLAEVLPKIHPETYPPDWKRNLEYIYNASRRFTYSYLAYFAAFIALMLAFAAGWHKALVTGGVFLAIGFVGHSLGLFARIALSDRPWTIHNQFESFFMLTWFAALAGLILLIVKRQWIYGAAASAISGGMLMIANHVPIPSSEIAPVAGILATSNILYVHVNIMIISYALIALALVLSLFYLFTYYSGENGSGGGGAGGEGDAESESPVMKVTSAGLDPNGGAAAHAVPAKRGRAAMLNDLDQAQMVVIQMVFWLLAVGILLGAYWADHSWGRWWAWDPKETWALILWIVYLMAVHLRFAVKRRGLVTAWMSVVGFFMMLWTHWGVNLLLAGLHSYA